MDVKTIIPIASGATKPRPEVAAPRAIQPKVPIAVPEIKQELKGQMAQAILKDSGIDPKDINRFQVKLDIDEGTGRVVAEIRNRETGELVNEVPSRKLLRQAALLKEALGTILDRPV